MKFSEIVLPTNRKFGLFFSLIFTLLYIYFFNAGSNRFVWVFAGLAIVFFIIAMTRSELLLPLNKLWMRFGLLLGMIVSPIVLGLIFFGIFTPIGILMRLFGRDELLLNSKTSASYWKHCVPDDETQNSFTHQF
jgi:hypothetical protein